MTNTSWLDIFNIIMNCYRDTFRLGVKEIDCTLGRRMFYSAIFQDYDKNDIFSETV